MSLQPQCLFIFSPELPLSRNNESILRSLHVSWKGKISLTADFHHVSLSLVMSSIEQVEEHNEARAEQVVSCPAARALRTSTGGEKCVNVKHLH